MRRDAIRDTGSITVETANVAIDEPLSAPQSKVPPGDYVRLTFSDTGEGMDEETISRIFEPFFTTKPVGEGTGLGLATVFDIVKQNRGYINVESTRGRGTTFSLYFPRVDGDEERATIAAKDTAQKGTETVLLVEDEGQLLQLAQSILETDGYRVLAAGSPGDAISLCERFRVRIPSPHHRRGDARDERQGVAEATVGDEAGHEDLVHVRSTLPCGVTTRNRRRRISVPVKTLHARRACGKSEVRHRVLSPRLNTHRDADTLAPGEKTYVVLAGNIGAGKSTLVGMICDRLGWEPYYEPVTENPYLADFYKDMRLWAFHSQVFFLTHRAAAHRC